MRRSSCRRPRRSRRRSVKARPGEGRKTGKPFGAFALGACSRRESLPVEAKSGVRVCPASRHEWVTRSPVFGSSPRRFHSFENRWNELPTRWAVPRWKGGIANLKARGGYAASRRSRKRWRRARRSFSPPCRTDSSMKEPASGFFGQFRRRLQDMQDQRPAPTIRPTPLDDGPPDHNCLRGVRSWPAKDGR